MAMAILDFFLGGDDTLERKVEEIGKHEIQVIKWPHLQLFSNRIPLGITPFRRFLLTCFHHMLRKKPTFHGNTLTNLG